MMLTELERINYIVGEFVLLSKPNQWQQLVPCRMSRMLGDIIPIMESQAIITNVTIQVEEGDTPDVLCDVNQIKQVLINLMKTGSRRCRAAARFRYARGMTVRGTLSLASMPDQGTTATIKLPVQAPADKLQVGKTG